MKQLKLALLSIVLCASSVASIYSQPATAQSLSNPFCWGDGGGRAVERDCNSSSNRQLIEAVARNEGWPSGPHPRSGFCYGFGFPVILYQYGSNECAEVRSEAQEQLDPPECFRLSGPIATYNQATFNPADLSAIACDEQTKNIFSQNQTGFEFEAGRCYVVAAANGTAINWCDTVHASLLDAAQERQRVARERGEAGQARNTCNDIPLNTSNCPLLEEYVVPAINILSASVGVVIVAMIIWGGIRYSSARDNPQQAAAAKDHIRNALIALVLYLFMFAFLEWLVPGGIFR